MLATIGAICSQNEFAERLPVPSKLLDKYAAEIVREHISFIAPQKRLARPEFLNRRLVPEIQMLLVHLLGRINAATAPGQPRFCIYRQTFIQPCRDRQMRKAGMGHFMGDYGLN